MPAPSTVDEFVDLVRKSAVLDDGRLTAYVKKLKADPATPKDVSSVAGLFIHDGLITNFQAEQFLQGKWKRFSIGKYKVLEKLGSGGMGQVFLCEHKLMRRRVAVKVLPTAKAADPSSLERFHREARAVAALDHPNIVRAYDIDQDDNLHFLVMEYVDGASMQEMIKRAGPMDPTRACHYMYWSAVGLQHAHTAGLIHRDIKPGNILVDRQGVVKILDLGLARFFNDDEDLLTKKYDESVLGTADYLAPEQAVDSHGVDGRADIYSLGATFYFLLTGKPPFADGSVAQKLLWHQTRAPKPVREVCPTVPEAVAQIVFKMMAKKPEDRYQTPAELAEALLPFTQTPIPPPPETEMPTLSAAAQGPAGGPVSVMATPRTIVAAPRTPPPAHGPRTPPGGKPSAPAPKPKAAPAGSGVAVADADTQRNNSVPAVEPPPSTPIWEVISAETANNARADTDRKRRDGSSRRMKPAPKSATKVGAKSGRLKTRRRLPLILIVAGGLVLLAAGALVAYFVRDKSGKPTTPQTTEPRRLVLMKSPNGAPLHYASMAKALSDFKSGDTIVIQDDEWEELATASRTKGLTITSADPTKKVIWRAPSGKGAAGPALLSLAGAEGAKITGIIFDAGSTVDHAVRLQGACPGLLIDNCELLNARVAPLNLHDCSGDKGKPVTIKNVRIAGESLKGGVWFSAEPSNKPGFPARGSEGVLLQNCLVEGTPGGVGFLFDGSAVADIRQCRVWKGAYGIQFRKALPAERPPSDLLWQVGVIGNTFHSQTGAGIWIEDAGQIKGRPENRIEVKQNFFAGLPAALLVVGDVAGSKFLTADATNVRKKGVGQPPIPNYPLPAMPETTDDVNTDPTNAAKLLTYDKASPLYKAANGKPAGAAPTE